jgi:aminopeptidase Y
MALSLAVALLSSPALATVLNVQQGGGSLDYGKPLVSSEALQASIVPKNLLQRAEVLFQIANASVDEYNHPTRVIGSEGRLFTFPVSAVCSTSRLNSRWLG